MKLLLEVFEKSRIRNAVLITLIALSLLLVINIIYIYLVAGVTGCKQEIYDFKDKKKLIKGLFSYFIALILLSCTIGVFIPQGNCKNNSDDNVNECTEASSEAVVYGMLVGLVVYGFMNIILFRFIKFWTVGVAIRNTCFGIVSVAIVSLITYYCANSAKLYN